MTLLDTNVLIYAFDQRSAHALWSREVIAGAVATGGAAIDAVSLAEIAVGDEDPKTVASRIRDWGVVILDVPAAAAEIAARAYRRYRRRRRAQSGREAPSIPLPDFFIGAHAEVRGWVLATVDEGRFRSYFPSVVLRTPER